MPIAVYAIGDSKNITKPIASAYRYSKQARYNLRPNGRHVYTAGIIRHDRRAAHVI